MPPQPHPSPAFQLCAGHAALDLVNSLDDRFAAPGPAERLTDYGALLGFAVQAGLLDARRARQLGRTAPAVAERVLRAVRELREALAATLYAHVGGRAMPAADLRVLERHFGSAAQHRELRWRGSRGRGSLGWDFGRCAQRPELPLWLLALSAADLMTSESLARVSSCGADSCRWLFLDTSRNHTRRWCDMRVCGNRMKARRFQARHEAHVPHRQ
jgi:predicted RNA-binding Zn ribbon-like protein